MYIIKKHMEVIMDLEKKLAIYYQGSAIEDDMAKCEATNDFSKIRRNSYDYFHCLVWIL